MTSPDNRERLMKLLRFDVHSLMTDEQSDRIPDEEWDKLDSFVLEVGKATCQDVGHEPVKDHCGIPDHDFCIWCGVLTPGEAKRTEKTDASALRS